VADPFPSFLEVVRRELALLAKADEVVRAATEVLRAATKARREMLRDAGRAGVNPALLKHIAKEKTFDEEMLEELASYRNAAFEETDLAKAAARAKAAQAKAAEAEAEETGLED
jgi:hypothetical protein